MPSKDPLFEAATRDPVEEGHEPMDELRRRLATMNHTLDRWSDTFQSDIEEILNELHLGIHARSKSAHQIVHDEIIPALRTDRNNAQLLMSALVVCYKHLQKQDPVIVDELYRETPALQVAIHAAKKNQWPIRNSP